jgi:hypothetical protein
MIKLEIVNGSLQVSYNGSIILVVPKNSCAIDVLALYDAIPFIVIYNKYLGNSTVVFNQPLANCEDGTSTPFTVNGFIAFAETNLGFDTSGGGGGSSPFRYDTNASGIEPCLGSNNASGVYSTIGGGSGNIACYPCSTVGGGRDNNANNYYSTIGGGVNNNSANFASTIGGGNANFALGGCSTVGGGSSNTASGGWSTIGGGSSNTASGGWSAVGGGYFNTATNCWATIGGGNGNNATDYFSTVGGGNGNNASSYSSTVGGGQGNNASGICSTIGGGFGNTALGYSSTIGGGYCNTASVSYSTIGGGKSNISSSDNSTIGGGKNNNASGSYSAILGGKYNNICNFANAMIVGSNLCATQACTTFMNCASADNLTVGCLVSVGANKVLENSNINASTVNTGLFAQTTDSVPVTATTVESSLIGVGVGTLSVPANAFQVGDSFNAFFDGILSCLGSATIQIKVKTSLGVVLVDSGIIDLDVTTSKAWTLSLQFTIRTLGTSGVASISSGGVFSYVKNGSNNFDGYVLSSLNNTTFDTTVNNTLVVTAQWNSNSASNSILSRNFVLNKIY